MHLSPKNTKLSLENKLVVLQLVTRLVGLHKLELLPVYSFMLKYLTPRQREVTHFLACVAQASHELVPPDVLEPLVKKIADEFVSDGVASEVATAGLNAVREICARAPLAMTTTLLQDLTEYKGSNDRGVMMAARSLIGLYRDIAPEMLKRKDRGKTASMNLQENRAIGLRYGEERTGVIEGLDLLEEWKEEQKRLKAEQAESGDEDEGGDEDGDEDGWNGWDVEEDEDSDNEGWINVESDQEIEISDSEDEEEKAKAPKKQKLTKSQRKAAEQEEKEIAEQARRGKSETNQSEVEFTEEQLAAQEEIRKEQERINSLATSRILTPADFAKLAELRTATALSKLTGSNKKAPVTPTTHAIHEETVTSDIIARTQAPGKASKEDKLAKVMEGREDREKFGSSKHKKLDEKAHSTTNKEKQRKKNFLMTLASAKRRQRKGLVERGKQLRGHAAQKKKQGQKRK